MMHEGFVKFPFTMRNLVLLIAQLGVCLVGTRPRVSSTIHQAQTPLPAGQTQVSPSSRSWDATPRLILS